MTTTTYVYFDVRGESMMDEALRSTYSVTIDQTPRYKLYPGQLEAISLGEKVLIGGPLAGELGLEYSLPYAGKIGTRNLFLLSRKALSEALAYLDKRTPRSQREARVNVRSKAIGADLLGLMF